MSTDQFSFSRALHTLKQGGKVARAGWNGKGMYIDMQVPDENSKMGRPYLFIKSVDDKLVPWLPSQTDLLAEDWFEVKPGGKPMPWGLDSILR